MKKWIYLIALSALILQSCNRPIKDSHSDRAATGTIVAKDSGRQQSNIHIDINNDGRPDKKMVFGLHRNYSLDLWNGSDSRTSARNIGTCNRNIPGLLRIGDEITFRAMNDTRGFLNSSSGSTTTRTFNIIYINSIPAAQALRTRVEDQILASVSVPTGQRTIQRLSPEERRAKIADGTIEFVNGVETNFTEWAPYYVVTLTVQYIERHDISERFTGSFHGESQSSGGGLMLFPIAGARHSSTSTQSGNFSGG
ncbi:MAG: hypothetical protein FWC83_00820, partial [Alphaproteobacteria bacterium]|nr:hypothetical protein [Alphaproteobacteria bacterium]